MRTRLEAIFRAVAILAAMVCADCTHLVSAAEQGVVRVAAAVNVRFAMDELVDAFRRERPGISVQVTYGASALFYAQLSKRAPFDMFFSADLDYPRRLIREGAGIPDSEFQYGLERLVVWVPRTSSLDIETLGMRALLSPSVRKIAIANPRRAVYGRAAEAAMKTFGIYDGVKNRLILGDSVMQTAQLVESGGAEVGMISYSLALAPRLRDQGRLWEVPIDAYPHREQGGVILPWAQDRAAAEAFRDFVLGEGGSAILRRHGFWPVEGKR